MPLYPAVKLVDTVISPDALHHQGAADDAASSLGASMGFSPDAFDFTTKPTAPEPGVWERTQELMDGKVEMDDHTFVEPEKGDGGTFDFTRDPKAGGMAPADTFDFTTEPTASEGRSIVDCESKLFVQTRLLSDGDDGSIDFLAVDPTNPNAPERGENISEITVVKYSDASTPKVLPAVRDDCLLLPAVQTDDRYTFAFDGYSNTGDGGIIIDYTPGPDDNAGLPSDVQKGEWITDVTYQSVELLGQPATETLTIAHEGFL